MKRINPITKEPFARGDTRSDGYRFYKYTGILKGDGTFKEIWLHPNVFVDTKDKARKVQAKNYTRKSSRLPKGWAAQLRDPIKIQVCRDLWQKMFNAAPEDKDLFDMEFVYDNGRWDSVRDLLMPYASDYNGV